MVFDASQKQPHPSACGVQNDSQSISTTDQGSQNWKFFVTDRIFSMMEKSEGRYSFWRIRMMRAILHNVKPVVQDFFISYKRTSFNFKPLHTMLIKLINYR